MQWHVNCTAVDCNDVAFTPTLRCCQLHRNSEEVRSPIQYDLRQTTWQRRGNKMVAQRELINTHPFGQSTRRTCLHSSLFGKGTLPARIHNLEQTKNLVAPARVNTVGTASSFFRLPATTFALCKGEAASVFCFSLSPKHIATNTRISG
jgi:hypothetical protein